MQTNTTITTYKDMKDKVIWITGASSGIGEALAKKMYSLGAKLVISARRTENLNRLKIALNGGDDVLVLPIDVSKFEELEKCYNKVKKHFGRVDILMNNAGVTQRSIFSETDFSVMKNIIDINFLGTAGLTRLVVPDMIKQKSGYILAVSSVAGKFSTPQRTIYSAAKMALQGLVDGLRAELYQHNIKVSLVVPGFVRTQISLNALNGSGEKHGKMDPNQAGGITSERAAEIIVKGIQKGKREILMGLVFKTRLAMFLVKYFPGVLARMMRTAKVT